MDKLAAYNALQNLAQQIGRRVDEGSIGADEVEQILASGRQIAGQVGLDPNAIDQWLQRAQGGISTPDVPGMGMTLESAKAAFDRSELPTSGVTFEQFLSTIGSKVDGGMVSEPTAPIDWMRGDNSTGLQNAMTFGKLFMAMMGMGNAIGALGAAGSAAGAAGAGASAGEAAGAFDTFGALNSPSGLGIGGTVADAAAGSSLGSSLLDPSLITSPVAPVSTGAAYGTADPFLQGVTQTMPTTMGASTIPGSTLGTAAPFTSGLAAAGSPAVASALEAWAAGAPAGAATGAATMPNPGAPAATASEIAGTAAPAAATQAMPTLDGEGGMVPGEYKDLGGTVSPMEAWARSLGLSEDLIKKLSDPRTINGVVSSLIGGVGASQQANATNDLYKTFLDLGKPYRDSLASLEANPAAYYQSPEVQGALQQGSDALARSLSAKVGNPILNPTALQEMQNYSTHGLLGQLNQRRSFLANAGGLGVGQAAQLGSNAAQSSGGIYNAIGAGLGTVFGNQRDYAGEMLDILRRQGLGGSGVSLP